MNIKQATILLGTAMLISVPLAFSSQAEARGGGGDGSRKGEHRLHDNRSHSGRHGYRKGDRRRHHGDHRRGHRSGHHGRYSGYRSYGYYYPRHDYVYDGSLALGLYWPYGLSIYYQDW
jgi:hypothetical protein